MAVEKDLDIRQGEDFEQEMTFLDSAAETGVADVSGWSWLSQIRDKAGTLLASLSFDTSGAADGKVRYKLAAADSWDVPPGRQEWDLIATTDQGKAVTLYFGTVYVEKGVSHE